MVNPRMAARPAGNCVTPMIDSPCQPSMLGRPSTSTWRHSPAPRGSRRSPRARKNSASPTAPSAIVSARKCSGPISRSDSFITGQFSPHISVSTTRPMSWRRDRAVGMRASLTAARPAAGRTP